MKAEDSDSETDRVLQRTLRLARAIHNRIRRVALKGEEARAPQGKTLPHTRNVRHLEREERGHREEN